MPHVTVASTDDASASRDTLTAARHKSSRYGPMRSPPGLSLSPRYSDGPACVWERCTITRDIGSPSASRTAPRTFHSSVGRRQHPPSKAISSSGSSDGPDRTASAVMVSGRCSAVITSDLAATQEREKMPNGGVMSHPATPTVPANAGWPTPDAALRRMTVFRA